MALKTYVGVGYSCNNNCAHCFNLKAILHLKEKNLPLDKSLDDIGEVLRDLGKRGINDVVFTGGEVTIRKDFFGLLRLARELGLRVGLQTNGRSFCSSDFARRTLEIAPDIYAIIPFHHTNERIFDEITRVKGSFSQTLCGVKNLIRYNVPELLLKVVILQQNYRDLENIVNLCNSLGLKRINFTFIEGGGNAKINWFKIAPHYSDIEQPLQKAIVLSKKKGIIVECYDIPFCFLKGHEECVSETNHYISPYLKGDSLERLSLKKENVIKDIVLSKRRKTKACAGCRFFDVCLGVWEEYLDYYGDGEFAPVLGKRVSGLNELINLQ